jgi:hypothetical protein
MSHDISLNRYSSIGATFLLVAATALTMVLAARTLFYLFHSVTNVPYPDQWVMLQEIWAVRTGRSGWNYLWAPYWGHRPVLPRLLMLLSVKYLHYSMLPFVITNVSAQISLLLVMMFSIRRLFTDRNLLFWLSAIVILHLLLSSLQMEIFVVGTNIMYTVGYASAVAAIVILGTEIVLFKLEARFAIALLLGIMSTTFVAIGPLIWPILIIEAWLIGARPKYLVILTALAALIIVAYSIGYTRPAMGMGVAGAGRHPIQAAGVAAFVLGGPISIYAPLLGVAAGAIGIASATGIAIYYMRTRSAKPAAIPLMMVVFFLLGSASSVAVGRITPDALAGHSGQPVSRYLAPTFVFWAALFPISLDCWNTGRFGRLIAAAVSVIVLILTFGTWNWQWRMPREWASVSQGYDAIASGFLAGVSDQEYMSRIISDKEFRSRMVDYMREQHLSVFAEQRAHWMDQNIKAIAPIEKQATCHASIKPVRLASNQLAFRIVGTLMIDSRAPRNLLDILMTDTTGIVKGLARTLPAQSEYSPAADFFGYARGIPLQNLRLFVLFHDKLFDCPYS